MTTLIGLAAATLISEDLTLLLAGVLIAQDAISPFAGVAACAIGIFVGDMLLFAAGRLLGARVVRWSRSTPPQHIGPLILGSRVVPGTRLPLYLAAGALHWPVRAFASWTAIAVVLWTPTVVLASANVIPATAAYHWTTRAALVIALFVVWRWAVTLRSRHHWRSRLVAAISRVWRWEFWPMWLFYAPVAAWLVWLVVKHRGVGVIAAANPGMPDGGIVGESKFDILQKLPAEWTLPSIRVEPGHVMRRAWHLSESLASKGWRFPVILKPDVGQRGSGVKLVRTLTEARAYLESESNTVVVQPYHRGPYEAGVFYYRFPGSARGRILSITDKHFPVVVGDGRSTIEDLIWAQPRLRMQARTFIARHGIRLKEVPSSGEHVRLAIAGNHCQGTLFRDGSHLITPALEDRIDSIARAYPGFFIGRFDIRYTDVERFTAGDDLAIVELNGATAESTNIYDPSGSLWAAYRQLFRQWSLVFAIGAANRDRGARILSLARLAQLVRGHLSSAPAFATSD